MVSSLFQRAYAFKWVLEYPFFNVDGLLFLPPQSVQCADDGLFSFALLLFGFCGALERILRFWQICTW